MAKAKPHKPVLCRWCNAWVYDHRLTLPRPISGDRIYCGYPCWQEEDEEARMMALLEEG